MDVQSSFKHHESPIKTKADSPNYLCKDFSIAQCFIQLKKNEDNFDVWERQLRFMIRNLTGTHDYLLHDTQKRDPKLYQLVLNFIFCTIDDELQRDLKSVRTVQDAFRVLTGQFNATNSNSLIECIMSRDDFPDELLEKIINNVHYLSLSEHISITERKLKRIAPAPQTSPAFQVYPDYQGPPILNTFQSLAVVNRRFYRICLPKLWQTVRFPSAVPRAMSLWTDQILLKHGKMVKSLAFKLEDNCLQCKPCDLGDAARSAYDNTVIGGVATNDRIKRNVIYGIGAVNIKKVFLACPSLESLSVKVPSFTYPDLLYVGAFGDTMLRRIKFVFKLTPRIAHLRLENSAGGLSGEFVISLLRMLPSVVSLEVSKFHFNRQQAVKDSFGWNVAQHPNLRKLRLQKVNFIDRTWKLKSWPKRITELDLDSCGGLSFGRLRKLLSGSAPDLNTLQMKFDESQGESVFDSIALRRGLDFESDESQSEPDVNDRFDLPALKRLCLISEIPLSSFKDCKNIQFIQCDFEVKDEEWDSIKDLLYTYTWPKLSVLDLRRSWFDGKSPDEAKKEVDEVRSFGVKLLLNQAYWSARRPRVRP